LGEAQVEYMARAEALPMLHALHAHSPPAAAAASLAAASAAV
jgi:hypothetical protein